MQQMILDGYAQLPSRTIACGEQPQNRFESHGAAALSDTELLAILLQNGESVESVLRIASELLALAGSITGLASWQPEDFQRVKGIGRSKARQLAALVEIGRRLIKGPAAELPLLDSAEAIANYLLPFTRGLEYEKFWVLCLNRKSRLKKLVEATSGTATSSLVSPAQVFRIALQQGATAVAVAHNHPSGSPEPSQADISVTRALKDASKAININLIDQLVMGEKSADPTGLGFYSFRSAGLL